MINLPEFPARKESREPVDQAIDAGFTFWAAIDAGVYSDVPVESLLPGITQAVRKHLPQGAENSSTAQIIAQATGFIRKSPDREAAFNEALFHLSADPTSSLTDLRIEEFAGDLSSTGGDEIVYNLARLAINE